MPENAVAIHGGKVKTHSLAMNGMNTEARPPFVKIMIRAKAKRRTAI